MPVWPGADTKLSDTSYAVAPATIHLRYAIHEEHLLQDSIGSTDADGHNIARCLQRSHNVHCAVLLQQ